MGAFTDVLWFLISAAVSAILALRGKNKASLSDGGAIAAFIVGVIHFYGGLRFGLTMIAFYLTSSKVTKYKKELKKVLEENYQKSSRRNAVQVLACSLTSSILVVLARRYVDSNPRALDVVLAAFLGHFACCCADTWSSEVGVVAMENPRLVTTFQVVPKGTNGAISVLGTAAGLAGGLLMGIVFWLTGKFDGTNADSSLGFSQVFLGLFLGFVGTMLDSLLGGTLQYTGHSSKTNKVVNRPGPDVTHIAGRDVLSNSAVNFVSAALTAVVGGLLVYSTTKNYKYSA